MTRGRSDGEPGVSSVVSAVLVFVLFTTAFVLWTMQTLPDWEADREHAHQREVSEGLGGLKSALEGLSARRDAGPVTAVVPLGTPPIPLLQTTEATGELEVFTGPSGFAASLNFGATPGVYLSEGSAVASPTAPTTSPPCSAGTRCVQSLEALVVGLATTGGTGAGSATLTLTATDSSVPASTVTATLTHVGQGPDCNGEVRLVAAGTPFPLLCGVGATLGSAATPYRVDLLDPTKGFGAALSRLKAPYSLTFVTSTTGSGGFAASTYTATWLDSSGIERVAGTGVATAKPVPDLSGGRLAFTPRYQQFPQQALSFEGGAVLASESAARQAVIVDPSFTLRVQDGVGYLRWTLVQLSGSGQLSGSDAATVQLTHLSSQDLVVATPASCSPCLTATLTTPNAAGWNSFFSVQSLAAGAGSSAAAGSGATGQLTLSSGGGQPVTGGWVLHLRVISAEAKVR